MSSFLKQLFSLKLRLCSMLKSYFNLFKWMFFSIFVLATAVSHADKVPPPKLIDSTIVLNWKAEPEFGGFYQASLTGLYEKAGFKMKIQEGGSGTPTLQMLVNGQTNYAIVSSEEILLHNAKDPKRAIVAVFTVFDKAPYMIMAHSDQGFKSLKDVFQNKDQVISVQKGLPYVDYLLKKHGPAKAQIVPYQGGIGLFEKNKKLAQQGFITSEFLLAEEKGLKPQSWLVADEGFNPYIGILAVRQDYLDQHKVEVEKVVQVTRQGWLDYMKAPDKTNTELVRLNPSLTVPAMQKSLVKMKELMIFPKSLQFGQMQPERWLAMEMQMIDLKLIPAQKTKPFKPDFYFQNF